MSNTSKMTSLAIVLALPLTIAPLGDSHAAEKTKSPTVQHPIDLGRWNMDSLYHDTWSVRALRHAAVQNAEGKTIGEVENVLIDWNGRIRSLIVDTTGYIILDDSHLAIPWNDVALHAGLTSIEIPVTPDNSGDYNLLRAPGYGVVSAADTTNAIREIPAGLNPERANVWRSSSLMSEYVTLKDGTIYGYVDDLVFNHTGAIKAVVVDPVGKYGKGKYAFPFYTAEGGFQPFSNHYTLPYSASELKGLKPFDEKKVEM